MGNKEVYADRGSTWQKYNFSHVKLNYSQGKRLELEQVSKDVWLKCYDTTATIGLCLRQTTSDESFLKLQVHTWAIVTNVEPEHMEYYNY